MKAASAASSYAPKVDIAEAIKEKLPALPGRARNIARTKLCCALYEKIPGADPEKCIEIGSKIEDTLFQHFGNVQSEYLEQVSNIRFNLSDPKNKEFALRVFNGEIAISALPTMSSKDMASTELKILRNEFLKENIAEHSYMNVPLNSTRVKGQYTCEECGSDDASFYVMPRLSSGEDIYDIMVTCIKCGHVWKVSSE